MIKYRFELAQRGSLLTAEPHPSAGAQKRLRKTRLWSRSAPGPTQTAVCFVGREWRIVAKSRKLREKFRIIWSRASFHARQRLSSSSCLPAWRGEARIKPARVILHHRHRGLRGVFYPSWRACVRARECARVPDRGPGSEAQLCSPQGQLGARVGGCDRG